jgi:hypothetical protein
MPHSQCRCGQQKPHKYPDDHFLLYQCPWCQASQLQPCVNRGTGRPARQPHDARLALMKDQGQERTEDSE